MIEEYEDITPETVIQFEDITSVIVQQDYGNEIAGYLINDKYMVGPFGVPQQIEICERWLENNK